jgi:glutathione synthase
MRILFIVDPLSTFKTYKDSTFAMMREAAARGYAIYTCLQSQLTLANNVVETVATPIALTGDEDDWYRAGDARLLPLGNLQQPRAGDVLHVEWGVLAHQHGVKAGERQGARVFNKPQAIRDHSEKLAIAQFREFTVPTIVSRDAKRLREFHAEQGDVIFKPLDGMGGAGIFRVGPDGLNLGAVIESLTDNGARTIMAQQYIPAIREGDKRILLIGGSPVPHSLARVPMAGEVRGNLAAGGTGRAQPLSERDQVIAHALAPVLWQRGLLLVGLDVIGDYLTEVNVTSPTCFQEITQQTGFNVAGMFIDALERAAGKTTGMGRKPA